MPQSQHKRPTFNEVEKLVLQLPFDERNRLRQKLQDSGEAPALEFISIPVRAKFDKLAKMWREQAGGQSSPLKQSMYPAYQQIVGMGEQVVPLILKELEERGGQWYWALGAITGDNPVNSQDAGNVNKMKAAWLDYGKSRHLI